MKLSHWMLLGLFLLLTVSCAGDATKNQVNESPASVTTDASVAPAQSAAESPSSPSQSASASTILKSGSFVSGEKPTEGTVQIVTQDGQSFLKLDDSFKTSDMGPDLVVILHRSNDVLGSTTPPAYSLKEGDYVLLAPLQKFDGAQQYAIPDTVNLADYKSAVIWCRKFNATFGAAELVTQ